MLTLYLLRHAKSAWGNSNLADIDRPLSPRGVRAADAMAAYMDRQRLHPTRILCSTACRTRHSLLPLLARLRDRTEIVMERQIYDLSEETYVSLIQQQGDTARLMLIGHNSATEETALQLIGSGDATLLADLSTKYPTGALAHLRFDVDAWSEITPQSGYLINFVKPRDLPFTPAVFRFF